MLAAAGGALVAVWRGGRLLSGAVGALRSQPTLVKRLEACLPSAAEADGIRVGLGAAGGPGMEDEAEAFRFAAEAAALTVLASEAGRCRLSLSNTR
jgi:hypothetical protein